MNVIKEIERCTCRIKDLLANDVENAKRYKEVYSKDVDIIIQANEKFIDCKSKELEAWCSASATAWEIPQDGIISKIKRTILMGIANSHINKISNEMSRAGMAREDLKLIRSRFDGFLYLT